MLNFLKTAVDDASSDQRTKIGAIYACCSPPTL